MEAYEAKAKIWNVEWDGHEIRLEFIIKKKKVCGIESLSGLNRTLLFFDNKCVVKGERHYVSHDNIDVARYYDGRDNIDVKVKTDDGNSYRIFCGVRKKGYETYYRWPMKKSFIDRICDWIYDALTQEQRIAWISVNGEMIFLSHFGGVDDIELLEKTKSK